MVGDGGHQKELGQGYVPFRAQFLVLVFSLCAGTGSILASVCFGWGMLNMFKKYVQYPKQGLLNKSIVITEQYDLYV